MAKKIIKNEFEKLVKKAKDNTITPEEKLKVLKGMNVSMKKADKLLDGLIIAMRKEIGK